MNKINYFINNNWFNEHIKKSKISPQFLDTIEEPEARNLDESKISDANISEAENNDITLNTTLDTKEIESDSNTNHIDSKNSDSKSSEKSDSDVVINNVHSDTNEDGKEINANRSQQNNEDPTVTRTEPIIDQAKEQSQVIEEITTTIPNTPPTPIIATSSPTVNVPKESVLIYGKEGVFMRLSNRIKILELNMSLSSQYLEKLSQHYRMQMDEMERTFNFTTAALKEATRISDERDHKQYERIIILEKRLEALQKTVNLYNTLFENLKFQSDIQMLAVVAIITMVLLIKLITHFFSKKRRRVRSNSENIKSSQLSSKQVETIVEKRIALFIATIKEKDRKDSASTQDPVNTDSSNIKSIDKESVETLLPKLTYEWFTGEDTF